MIISTGLGENSSKSMIPYDPIPVAMEGVWKIVGYATGAILLWSYLKTRKRGE